MKGRLVIFMVACLVLYAFIIGFIGVNNPAFWPMTSLLIGLLCLIGGILIGATTSINLFMENLSMIMITVLLITLLILAILMIDEINRDLKPLVIIILFGMLAFSFIMSLFINKKR